MEGRCSVERKVVINKGEPMSAIAGTAEFKLQDKNWLTYSDILG